MSGGLESATLLPESAKDAHERLLRGLERAAEITAEHEFPNPPSLYTGGFGGLEPISLGKIDEPRPQEGLLGGLIAKGFPTTLYGDGGNGKSYLALGIATAMASGKNFLGFPLPKARVLYLDWELSVEAQGRRAFKIARGLGLQRPPKRLLYIHAPKTLPKMIVRIRQLVHRRKIACVIIDSFGPACGSNPEAAEGVMPLFNDLRSLGVTVLILDHQAKMQEGQSYAKKTPFGSAFKFNLSRSVLQLEKVPSVGNELKIILRQTKNNFGAHRDDLGLNIVFDGKGASKESVSMTLADLKRDPAFSKHLHADEKILNALREFGPATKSEIAERTGIKAGTVENKLPVLQRVGKVIDTMKKKGRQTIWALANSPIPRPYNKGDLGSSKLKLKIRRNRQGQEFLP